jgi:type I restriction-modification system DNA methylase subunit
MLRRDFRVWVDGMIRRVDLVGFGDSNKYDMSTATLLCSDAHANSYDQIFRTGRAIATPAVLIASDKNLEIWNLAELEEPTRLGDIDYENFSAFTDYRKYLEPSTVLSAKRGRQLALFPQAVELMTAARKSAADRLSPIVEEALRSAIRILDPNATGIEDAREREDDPLFAKASELTIGALTELMIAAKFQISYQDESLLRRVLRANFQEFAAWRAQLHGRELAAFQAPLDILRTDIDYSGLEPSLASEVYETALLPKREPKKRAGIFYTPPELARRLVDLLPIEELPPTQRNVLDPTCGSGTLLLAAHDRLAQIDPEADAVHVHQRLLNSLYGWDRDPFAVNIARLCLLLNALPQGNGWRVLQRDTLDIDQPNGTRNPRIDIVVMNPPWEHSHRGSNEEQASKFLGRAASLVRPGGLIGAVMPAGWLTKDTCRDERKQFLDLCELMEIVRLPERVFPGAEYAPALVVARRSIESPSTATTWLHRRVLHRDALQNFFRSGFVDESEVVAPSDTADSDVLTTNSLVKALRRRALAETIGDVADVLSVPPAKDVKHLSGQGDWLWLRRAGSIPGFGSITHDSPLQRVRFPHDFSRGENVAPRSFNEVKVLVSSKKRPDNPWRLKPILDLIGVIPRESLYLVVATEDRGRSPAMRGESYEDQLNHAGQATLAIFALLGSAAASAWIDGHNTILNIHRKFILSLPLPRDWLSLAELGKRLALEAHHSDVSIDTTRKLDEDVFRLYGLDEDEKRNLIDHMAGFGSPENAVRYSVPRLPITDNHESRYYGATLAVNGDCLLLWAPGVTDDDGIWINPPLAMPGAAARQGATFTAYGKDLAEAMYGFQKMSFVDDEALTRQRSS